MLASRRTATVLALVLVAALGSPPVLLAQNTGAIRGTVRNSADNSPVSGAQVSIEGQRTGMSTNDDGRYTIVNVPPGTYTVSVQLIGFAPERRENVQIAAGQTVTLDFQLRTQVLSMAEIVVTGVTEATSRAKIPFTVAKVSSEAVPVAPRVAVGAIQGRVAGVNMIQAQQPGEGAGIVLRTPTSINRSNSPLIVVDGAILTDAGGNNLSITDLSALDIESIEIVKGAAAASLYGSRAAAGVIQIRTQRGSQFNEGVTRVRVRTEYGSNSIMRPIEWARMHNLRLNAAGTSFVDAAGRDTTRQFAAAAPFSFQDNPFPGRTYDHIKAFFDPGQFVTNSFTIGHNSGNTNWLATGSQHHTGGVVLGNDGYKRYDFRVNLDHRLRNDLSVALSAFHMRSKQEDLAGDPFFDFIHQAPDINLLQADPDGTPYAFQPDPIGIRANPLYQIATQDHWERRARTIASLDLRYNPVAWLALTVNGSYDRSDRDSTAYIPRGAKTPESPNGSIGSTARGAGVTTGVNASAGASVVRTFGQLQARSSVRVLAEQEDNHRVTADGADAAVGGIPDLDAFLTLGNGSNESSVQSRGYYLTTDLDYGDKYIFSGLLRRDGSSLFGPEQRWHNYYRASAAYRMSAESWWPLATVNEFKLHVSRGTAGGRPNFADRFETFGLGTSGLTLQTLGNDALRPEKTTETEFGLDVVAFERFSVSLTYAKQRTVDELVQVPLPSLFGFPTQWQNAGTIEGQTLEATLEARLIERPNTRWSVSMVADRSRNRISAYDRPCHTDALSNRCAGARLGEMYADRLWRSHDDLPAIHANSRDAFQVNDDGLLVPVGVGRSWQDGTTGCTDLGGAAGCWGKNIVIDGISYAWGMPRPLVEPTGVRARVLVGNANPDLNWGVSSMFKFHDLNLYALFGGQLGGDVYNSTKQRMYQHLRHRDIDQDGKPEERKKPTTYYSGPLYNANTRIDWFVEDATYAKLREASIRYGLRTEKIPVLRRIGSDQIWLSVVGRNLFVLTNYSGYDPEVGGVITRIDNFAYPTYRTFTFSAEISF